LEQGFSDGLRGLQGRAALIGDEVFTAAGIIRGIAGVHWQLIWGRQNNYAV
jgi:hypothetical protein